MTIAAWQLRLAEAPLAVRFALAVGVFGVVVAGAAAGLGYWGLSRQLDARLDAELAGKQSLLQHVLSEIPSVEQIPANGHRFGDLLIGHKGLHLAVVDPRTDHLLATFSATAAESLSRIKDAVSTATLRWQGPDKKRYVSVSGPAAVGDGQAVRVVLSLDLDEDQQLKSGIVGATLLTLPVLLALVVLGTWVVARTSLAPLNRLTSVASHVTTHNLRQRIEPRGLPAELRMLALGLNAMLDRIDAGVHRLSEFSADLAHEMRTPVATLLGRTQVALSQSRSIDDLREVLAGNVEELDRLTRLIADMLFLARAEEGDLASTRADVDLAGEAAKVAEFLSVVADERDVRVEVTGSATVRADQLLVERAITNLLTNAIRHADAHSTVTINTRMNGDSVVVDVSNGGPGIPAHQLTCIFDRFVRLDTGRDRSGGAGTGLGLAIVKSIMRLHGGDVEVTSELNGTTTFSLVFPLQSRAGTG
ncbi:heavy metal sensor histidine kinase [Aquabacterium sp. J223]|uniref:heavy metal sensor histidine kinase n=1 Tax=Aquabacterium sp. J223 TaxID=2898431 RepID=UPI0021AD8F84|nr:heavy metal sensor histidine kinase [Aquabacterium sp. J223]UUX96675.1 heavy metal sensor histidine kinase [Aquabacterium sp. J223]